MLTQSDRRIIGTIMYALLVVMYFIVPTFMLWSMFLMGTWVVFSKMAAWMVGVERVDWRSLSKTCSTLEEKQKAFVAAYGISEDTADALAPITAIFYLEGAETYAYLQAGVERTTPLV